MYDKIVISNPMRHRDFLWYYVLPKVNNPNLRVGHNQNCGREKLKKDSRPALTCQKFSRMDALLFSIDWMVVLLYLAISILGISWNQLAIASQHLLLCWDKSVCFLVLLAPSVFGGRTSSQTSPFYSTSLPPLPHNVTGASKTMSMCWLLPPGQERRV